MIYIQGVLKERMSHERNALILIHEQGVYRRDTKWKKAHLMNIDDMAM